MITAAVLAALSLALTGCSSDTDRQATATTTTTTTKVSYYETAGGKREMVDTAKGVIAAQASLKGYVVTNYGPAKFPTALEVVMWGDVTDPGNPPSRLWFKVMFAEAGGSVTPFGPAKVALSETGEFR
ncbi:hypothetical protein [Nocardia wallacei]|uniref:hypothetical protein n=1 Tax=Nocardia wallacei TaxID=480035 RepID=UPI002454B131|nr:hypothetical protein [Nocardia wallacei]